MPKMTGVTTNLDQKRKQHTAERRNLRKWVLANGGEPFATRDLAVAWLKTQPGEKDPQTNPAPGQWFGYSFEYDVG